MAIFKVSKKADQDLLEIGAYTQQEWGIEQRNKYLDELYEKFQPIANEPDLGRSCDHIRKGYRSYSVGKHIIFYRSYSYGIRVVRVLHQQMDLKQHL